MNTGDRVDDEKEDGEDKNRNKIKRHISVRVCVRQPLFLSVFVFQDNLPLLRLL